jgi:hypothetical protein
VPVISFGGRKKCAACTSWDGKSAGTCRKLPVLLFRGTFITVSIIFAGTFKIASKFIAGTSKSAANFILRHFLKCLRLSLAFFKTATILILRHFFLNAQKLS